MGDTVPKLRGSEVGLYKRCPWAWWQAYRMGLKSKRVKDALWFGELVHIALAAWYCGPGAKRGPHPAETFQKLSGDQMRYIKTTEATEDEVAKWTDLREMGIILLNLYVETYGRDERFLMIAPEQTFSFDIPFPDWWGEDTRRLLVEYVGTFDGVYRDAQTGWLWLLEHKTAKSISVDHLPLDNQGGSYWAVATRSLLKAGLIKPTERLHGINYNFIRKGLPDDRPRDEKGYALNKDGSRSKRQPPALFHRQPVNRTRAEQKSQLLRIQNDAAVIEMARRGELPITKTTHRSCKFCEYVDMCKLHETGGHWQDLRTLAYRVEDPYADHRKSTDEALTFEMG